MFKPLFFIILIGFSLNASSMRKKKQLELLESCKVFTKQHSVFAGDALSAYLSFALSTGEVIHSNGKAKIGFKDFVVTVRGSGAASRLGRKRVLLSSYYEAINDPYIHIDVQMINRPEIRFEYSIPIHFTGKYKLNYSGSSGMSGGKGECGRNGRDGRGNFRDGDGRDGDNGHYGFDGQDGRNGYHAPNVDVYVSLVDFPRDRTELVKVESHYPGGRVETRYLSRTGSLNIYALGGSGGVGGNGGRGGNGGDGSTGLFKVKATGDRDACNREGYGGNGGYGGFGGNGGRGGIGGDGGDVNIYFSDNTWFFKNSIYVKNHGGAGGSGGCAGAGGKKGEGAKGGRGCGYNGEKGNTGYNGPRGGSGRNGNIYFHSR